LTGLVNNMKDIAKQASDPALTEAQKDAYRNKLATICTNFKASCDKNLEGSDKDVFIKEVSRMVVELKNNPDLQTRYRTLLRQGFGVKETDIPKLAGVLDGKIALNASLAPNTDKNPPKIGVFDIENKLQQGMWDKEGFLTFLNTNIDGQKAFGLADNIRNYGKPTQDTSANNAPNAYNKAAGDSMREGVKTSLVEKLNQIQQLDKAQQESLLAKNSPFITNLTNFYNSLNNTWYSPEDMANAVKSGDLKTQLAGAGMYEFMRLDDKTPASPVRYVGKADSMQLPTKAADGKEWEVLPLKAGTEIMLTGRTRIEGDGSKSVEASVGAGKEKKTGYIAAESLKLRLDAVEAQVA